MKLFGLLVNPDVYLDPGSGSMSLQIVLDALLGVGAAFRIFWNNIKAFFIGKKSNNVSAEDAICIIADNPTAVLLKSTSINE